VIKQFWHAATHIGITGELDPRECKRVTYVNFITLIATCYAIIRAIVSIPDYSYSLKLLVVACLGGIVLLLNHKHLYLQAKISVVIFWVTVSTCFSYLYLGGFTSGSTIILITPLPMIFIVFAMKHKNYIIASSTYLLTCIGLLIILSYVKPIAARPEIDIEMARISITILATIILLIISWYFHSSNTLFENELIQANNDLEIALKEIKILQGILPICSYCKNVRGDEGSWEQMESYISTHSDTEFSHGICPDCLDNAKKESGYDDI